MDLVSKFTLYELTGCEQEDSLRRKKRMEVTRQKPRMQMKMSRAIWTLTSASTCSLSIVIRPPSENEVTQRN